MTPRVCSIFVLTVAMALAIATTASADDIVCSAKSRRFAVPGACQQACVGGGLRNFIGCAFAPECPAFKSDQQLAVFYNQALFGRGVMRGDQARQVLLAHLINRYLRPHRVTEVNVSFVETTEFWAALDRSSRSGKPLLEVANDTFWLTPAFLASTLGHEFGHYEQMSRKPALHPLLAPLVDAFRELEAYHWELNLAATTFSFGNNPFLACMEGQERQAIELNFRCSDWDTRNLLNRFGTGVAASRYAVQIRKWLAADPWISRAWLPTHASWETSTVEAQPSECRKPRRR